MSYEGILDTNLFIRYLHDGTPEEKEKFRNLIERARSKGTTFYIPFIVVVEMVYVLERVYGLPKARVREMVENILTLPVEVENLDVVLTAFALYEEKNLKFGDALVLATAKVKEITPIYTFDKDFRKFSEARVL
ncbi:PIN domain-containing protein [Hydrogenivirga sp. 128-5-R1-1]|uniref:PIN domain-containing protein n=1 Tax=Hydrogenivirga sp. 128-5-R1-1 TaxID=392423 RepID=UPI00015F32FE|nr:PIN domain-containing protein [Hydrogenivirga sp. 128-5-R1-1]EDP74822.1 hypothetical protein HG1285_13177 [Hydrogenivirga sp. 128-5-R1-1]